MGTVIATCGHQLTKAEELGTTIAVAGYARDCGRAVDYLTVCDKCLKWYERKKLRLTEQQADEWLSAPNSVLYCIPPIII